MKVLDSPRQGLDRHNMEDGRSSLPPRERFTRVKLQKASRQALQSAFETTGARAEDIDVVAPFFGWQEETRLFEKNISTSASS
jgi:hypothetical protein